MAGYLPIDGGNGGGGSGGDGLQLNYNPAPYTANTAVSWDERAIIINNAQDMDLTLPAATAADVGRCSLYICTSSPSAFKVRMFAPTVDGQVNAVPASGAEVARCEYNSQRKQAWMFWVWCVGENSYLVEEPDAVFAELFYKVFTENTSLFGDYDKNSLELSAIPPNFLTSNADWGYAIKFRGPMAEDSSAHAFFASNSLSTGFQGNGQYYYQQNSGSGYLCTLEPDVTIQDGYWFVVQYDSGNDHLSLWINGINVNKVANNSSGGNTPSATPPTRVEFGTESDGTSYTYPLREFSASYILILDALITDAEAGEFVYSQNNRDGLTAGLEGKISNAWAAGPISMLTDKGAIDMTVKIPTSGTTEIQFGEL